MLGERKCSISHVKSVNNSYLIRRLPVEFLENLKAFAVVVVGLYGPFGQYLTVCASSPHAPQIGHV